MYCTMLSERLVVSFISTFSDVHSVDVLHFLITASARWFCTVLHWITCADAVALDDDVISPSPGMGRYSWYQSYRVRTLWPGVGHVIHSACSTSIHAICR